LNVYSSSPLTKADLLDKLADGEPIDADFANKFRIKRAGKDADDVFWAMGKIHGLENIAYATKEEFERAATDPLSL
jgi:hypothetical protein